MLAFEGALERHNMFFQLIVTFQKFVSLLFDCLDFEIFRIELQLHFNDQVFVFGDNVF